MSIERNQKKVQDEKIAKSPKKSLKIKSTITLKKSKAKLNTKQSNSNREYPQLIFDNGECLFDLEKYKILQKLATEAYHNRKIFIVHGNYGRIRQALRDRGWIEKLPTSNYLKNKSITNSADWRKKPDKSNELISLSKLVEKYPCFFVWQTKGHFDKYKYVKPYRNRIRCNKHCDFSTKLGLIKCSENAKWNTIEGIAELKYPRFYRSDTYDNRLDFLDDFRITHCLSLLNYMQSLLYSKELCFDSDGIINLNVIDFAIELIKHHVDPEEVLPELQEESNETKGQKFNELIKNIKIIINKQGKFKLENQYTYFDVKEKIENALLFANRYWPTLQMDGYQNLWILKPGYQCRGNGIVILQNYDEIMEFIEKRPNYKYIIQKYIEKPLLIYNTKFDIRQYILITITDAINIWMYTDCYLRFSSQEYTLNHLRESVHLTNNSVQKKYQNDARRHSQLPTNNMWSLMQFLNFLKTNYVDTDIWPQIIYPGLKRNVIGLILSSLDEMQITTNSFELYGCDFMLDEKFQPILIEVNSTPDLSPSTKVTAKICPIVQDDLIKVVVDLPNDINTATGNFELIYKINREKIALESRSDLLLLGKKMKIRSANDY